MPFVPGARTIQIVNLADGKVLASKPVSATPPTIGNVALQNAPDPIAGVVTITWNASDADNNSLAVDLLYSRDGGASFQPLQMGVGGSSATIDTSQLGGGAAILRVVASDGINTAQADTAPFTMATKPPQPRIVEPGDGTRIQFGQLVNLNGEAEDAQDGRVEASALVWTNQNRPSRHLIQPSCAAVERSLCLERRWYEHRRRILRRPRHGFGVEAEPPACRRGARDLGKHEASSSARRALVPELIAVVGQRLADAALRIRTKGITSQP